MHAAKSNAGVRRILHAFVFFEFSVLAGCWCLRMPAARSPGRRAAGTGGHAAGRTDRLATDGSVGDAGRVARCACRPTERMVYPALLLALVLLRAPLAAFCSPVQVGVRRLAELESRALEVRLFLRHRANARPCNPAGARHKCTRRTCVLVAVPTTFPFVSQI